MVAQPCEHYTQKTEFFHNVIAHLHPATAELLGEGWVQFRQVSLQGRRLGGRVSHAPLVVQRRRYRRPIGGVIVCTGGVAQIVIDGRDRILQRCWAGAPNRTRTRLMLRKVRQQSHAPVAKMEIGW